MVNVGKFLIGAGTLVSGFALAPLSVGAQDTQPLQGNVSTSTIDISVSPRALLNLPDGLLKNLPVAGGALDKLSIKLDTSSVNGILTGARNDLDSGHAVSKAVDINLLGLDQLLGQLTSVIGTLNQVTTLVPSLGGQITPLISNLTAPINGLVGGLGSGSVNKSVSATLAHGGAGSTDGSNVLNHLSPLPGLDLTLAPFAATATNTASVPDIAKKLPGITGPQTEAHSTTQNLAIGQTLTLPNLGDLTGLLGTVNGLISGLTPIVNQVTQLPPAQQVTATVGSILGNPAIPAPLQAITGPLATQLSSGTPVAAVTSTLTDTLNKLQGALGILNGLNGLNGLSLNKLIAADGVTTSSLLQPQSNGVHGLATSKFTDVKLLQLLGDQLSTLLGTPLGTPLLELTGAQSSAEALVDGASTAAPTGSSKLGAINVLGRQVLDLGAVLPPGTSQTIPVDVGAFALTLQVTSGVPVIANSSASHKSVQVGALDVTLYNGRPDGSGTIPLLGGNGIGLASAGTLSHARLTASGSNAIVKASFASSAVDVAAGPVGATTPGTNASSPQAQGELPKTGKLGPVALLFGAVLIAGGLSMRLIPGLAGRLRRRQ